MGSHAPKEAAHSSKNTFLIPLAIGIVLVVIVIVIVFGGVLAKKAGSNPSQSGSAGSSKQEAALKAQLPTGTICLPFSVAGATCDIGKEGTAWMRPDASSAIPENAEFCWDNKPEEFRLIQYMIGGKTHTFDWTGPRPSNVSAYRFFPKDRTTLVYNLGAPCRSA